MLHRLTRHTIQIHTYSIQNINSLETCTWDSYHVVLISQHCNFMFFNSMYFRTLGRPRRKWVDSIRIDLQEVGCGYMDWIGLVQDRDRWRTLVSAVMNLRVP